MQATWVINLESKLPGLSLNLFSIYRKGNFARKKRKCFAVHGLRNCRCAFHTIEFLFGVFTEKFDRFTGTTVLGAFDPLEKIADLCEKYKIWMHVDAAWGGEKPKKEFSSRFDTKFFSIRWRFDVSKIQEASQRNRKVRIVVSQTQTKSSNTV